MTPQDPRTADAGRVLRSKILHTSARDVGIAPSPEAPAVWGVVMDWYPSEEIATVVSLVDGTASLYTTSTFGIIGGESHERVRSAAIRFARAAGAHLAAAQPAAEFPYPRSGAVRFYLLTFDGVFALTGDVVAIEQGTDRLRPLFDNGQDVLTELRRISEDSGPPEVPQLFGIPGYLNCLLTSMSRGIGNQIEISASRALPNLDRLSADKPDLNKWIRAQQFDYGALPAKELIDLVESSTKLTELPPRSKQGSLQALHRQPNGAVKACVFDLEIAAEGRTMRITMAADSDPRVIGAQLAANDTGAG